MPVTGSRKPDYGICGACGRSRHLRANGTIGAHQYMTPYGHRTSTSCPGVGTLPRERTKPVMPQRHRYATRAELVELLASTMPETNGVPAAVADIVLHLLEQNGVQVDALVKIAVDAETDRPLGLPAAGEPANTYGSGAAERIAELSKASHRFVDATPVNTCETDADAAHRFAGQVGYAEQLLSQGIEATDALAMRSEDPKAWQNVRAWRERAAQFPHNPENKDR